MLNDFTIEQAVDRNFPLFFHATVRIEMVEVCEKFGLASVDNAEQYFDTIVNSMVYENTRMLWSVSHMINDEIIGRLWRRNEKIVPVSSTMLSERTSFVKLVICPFKFDRLESPSPNHAILHVDSSCHS